MGTYGNGTPPNLGSVREVSPEDVAFKPRSKG